MEGLPKNATIDTIGACLRRSAKRYPHKEALVSGATRLTYSEFNVNVNRFAHAIMKLGLKQGDKVTLMAQNSIEFLTIWFGLAKAGMVMVPMNLMLQGQEAKFIINHSESKVFIVEDAFLASIENVLTEMPGVERFIYINTAGGAVPEGMIEFNQLIDLETNIDELEIEVDSEDIAAISYTSGTESLPKGVRQTHRGIISEYVSSIIDGELRHDDIATVTMPMFHNAQLHCFTGPHVYLGATQIILPKFEEQMMLETIAREKITFTFGLPAQYRAMLAVSNFNSFDLKSLRMCTYAMAPVSDKELTVFMEKFRPKRGFQIYFGQTEMSPVTTILNPEEHLKKVGSVGKAVLNVEVAIMDDEGNLLSAGQLGEIVYRGGHIMKDYFKEEEKTREAFKYGWFHSGDLARLDSEGYLWFEDRKKDMVKTGGENVSTLEVEKCIFDHPKVFDIAVIGVPHPRWIEALVAAIVPIPGKIIEVDEIINHCKEHLAGYKVPKYVIMMDSIPKTATGKTRKVELRKQLTEQLDLNG